MRVFRSKTCEQCGVSFRPRGGNQRFCSSECFDESKRRACVGCGLSFLAVNGHRNQRYCTAVCATTNMPRTLRRVYSCKHCRRSFRPKEWGRSTYCSRSCASTDARSDRYKASSYVERRHQDHSNQQRARRAGCEREVIDVLDVFERDGWRCQICQKVVNRDLRHPHPQSPTLDHIVPLSCGGGHVRANVQLAHFRCNTLKRGKCDSVQLRLIG